MRFLNKIVFINSAHIRYGEVAVDGNVHFTGTQGVGKTTLLRALLFFYNARKDKLGIRTQGQRGFDDFYVPTPASYIIYEVARGADEPPFCAVLFRHNGRAAFRLVDAAFDRAWFIDPQGVVATDAVTVRQRLQSRGIDSSGIIDRYSQYLDIIYGNRTARLPKDVLKYYLLRSQQYQNIPRIVQNVFLNERVDADFIKSTIINSITGDDEEIAMDLNFFRSKLANFANEMDDISLWTTRNRKGVVETRVAADKIIGMARDITASEHSIREQCGMLLHARSRTERDLPGIVNRITKKRELIADISHRQKALDEKYRDAHEKLLKEVAILGEKLKEASALRKKYDQMGIGNMIMRVEKLTSLKNELRQKERMLADMMTQYSSIAQKFTVLRERLSIALQQYEHDCKEQRSRAQMENIERDKERLNRRQRQENDVRDKYEVRTEETMEAINAARELLHEQQMQRQQARASSPMKDELDECRKNITSLDREATRLKEKSLELRRRLDAIQYQIDSEGKSIEAEYTRRIMDRERDIDKLKADLDAETRLLERSQGSLCEWLDSNVEGWERSIGKIADEKDVLYSQNLHPSLSVEGTATVFGVNLDLDAIDKAVRTPSMIAESIASIKAEISAASNDIIALRDERDRAVAAAVKKLRAEMKSVKGETDVIGQKIHVCRLQSDKESLRSEEIKREEKKRLAELDAEFEAAVNRLRLKVEDLTAELKKINESKDREMRSVKKAIDEESRIDRQRLEQLLKSIDDDLAAYRHEHNVKVEELDEAERKALADSGADTEMHAKLKGEIAHAERLIEKIENERRTVDRYRDDCDRLLDIVPKLHTDKKKLEDKDTDLRQKYDERHEKLLAKREEEEKALSTLSAARIKAEESLQKANEFVASSSCPPELKEALPIHTDLDCTYIVDTIRQLAGDIYHLTESLKTAINDFRRRFSTNNTFGFPIAFDTTADYRDYARSLDDFVSNDKIREFQQMTNTIYTDVLKRTANDFSILLEKESGIQRIVREINYDFSRKTFAGVIRSIELRLDRSTMPIITQLQNITDFWNAHQYEIGELNLFSTDDSADANRESVRYLKSLTEALNHVPDMKKLPLEQTFSLKFKVEENDNSTGWIENMKNVGSEGTDTLVKAIVNILLISVFKKRASQAGDFRIHCMMDEIGRLADENIQGILNFANERDIFIVNSAPKAHRPLSYRRLYMLSKDSDANTVVQPILSTRQASLQ